MLEGGSSSDLFFLFLRPKADKEAAGKLGEFCWSSQLAVGAISAEPVSNFHSYMLHSSAGSQTSRHWITHSGFN